MLFKRFADINSIDIELGQPRTSMPSARRCGSWGGGRGRPSGGINLEDIKAPECFMIEQRLKEEMDIPVFQRRPARHRRDLRGRPHQTLCTSRARKIEDVRIVLNGAGAAGIACVELLKSMGARPQNMHRPCDTKGVLWQGAHRGHEPVEVGPCGQDRPA